MSSSINLVNPQIDVASIVDALITSASTPVTQMQNQVSTFQSRVTAYQTLNTKLSTLLTGVNKLLYNGSTAPLVTPGPFETRLNNSVFSVKKASSSNEDVLTATASQDAASGSYSLTVAELAKAQVDVSDGFDNVGEVTTGLGDLNITVDGTQTSVHITTSNNTLQGVMQAINDADAGVTASIVNDGTAHPYRLAITSDQTGMANSVTIDDQLDLSGKALNLDTKIDAANSHVVVNGIDIYRSTNTISDVISGTTLNLVGLTGTGPATTITVGPDADAMVTAMKSLVTAYNDINTYISGQTTYNSQTKTAGVLSGDSSLRDIQSRLQSIVTQSVSNSFTSLSVLSQAGVSFNRDGSLSLDESKFRNALANNLTSTAALFLGNGALTDTRVTYSGQTSATQPGTYSIDVTSLATQASIAGSITFDSLAQDELITITNGSSPALDVQLSSGDTFDEVLGKINTALTGAGIAATASDAGSHYIVIKTTGYGSSENLKIRSDIGIGVSGSTGFGTVEQSAAGTDIAGTINGHAAAGSGLTLTGLAGNPLAPNPEEGLSLTIAQTLTGSYGSITVTTGSTSQEGSSPLVNLQSALKNITDPLAGPIHLATDSLNQNIRTLNDRISDFQDRLEVQRELLTNEYNQADQALRLLTVNQNSLSSLISSIKSS